MIIIHKLHVKLDRMSGDKFMKQNAMLNDQKRLMFVNIQDVILLIHGYLRDELLKCYIINIILIIKDYTMDINYKDYAKGIDITKQWHHPANTHKVCQSNIILIHGYIHSFSNDIHRPNKKD